MKVEQLDLKDREEFGRIVNILLAENCIYQYAKIRQFEKKERNADYVFIHDHWDCFEEYLRYAGWLLCRERSSYMGMIYLVNEREDCSCRYRLTKLETQLLLILRNYYEEKMLELDASLTIRISVNELLQLLVDVHAMVSVRPSMQYIHAALQSLQRLNILQKYTQGDEELILVLPYITCVLTPKRVEEILRKLRNEEGEEDDEAEENAAGQLAVLREDDPEL